MSGLIGSWRPWGYPAWTFGAYRQITEPVDSALPNSWRHSFVVSSQSPGFVPTWPFRQPVNISRDEEHKVVNGLPSFMTLSVQVLLPRVFAPADQNREFRDGCTSACIDEHVSTAAIGILGMCREQCSGKQEGAREIRFHRGYHELHLLTSTACWATMCSGSDH